MSPRRSRIWKPSPEEFRKIMSESKNYTDALARFGLKQAGGNHRTLKNRIEEEDVDVNHFEAGAREASMMAVQRGKTLLSEILVEKSTYNRSHLKTRLLDEDILKNECYECGQQGTWNGMPLKMVLDHVNGVSDDNRIWNLRMLCPNCNSQQPTFAGRNQNKVVV